MPYYPPSGGGGSTSSAGLAGTGPLYILNSADSTLPNSLVLKSGSSTIVRSDGAGSVYVDASTGGNSSITKYLPYYIMGNSGPLGLIFDRPLTAG